MTHHTPGPWTSRKSYSQGEPTGYVISGEFENVADVLLGSFGPKETEANALLIAQAPAMLLALKKIINNWGNLHHKDRQQARAAIAKAEGSE